MTEDQAALRDALLEEVRQDIERIHPLPELPTLPARVETALREVPRHVFVSDEIRWAAYMNQSLPIGHHQTISQPYIVALMTGLIDPKPGDHVLEVGTGSGYQAAILSRLVKKVYSIELIDALALEARERLQRLGYDNIEVRTGNGYMGWPEHAPYDAILVTAAAPYIPPALIEQLKPGGIMIIPLESAAYVQDLMRIKKDASGQCETSVIIPVSFVPLLASDEDEQSRYPFGAGFDRAINGA